MVRTNNRDAWLLDYTPHQLETRVASEPLTREDVRVILEETVEKTRFRRPEQLTARGLLSYLSSTVHSSENVNVYIQKPSLEEEELTLIQEIVHLQYRIGDKIPLREFHATKMRISGKAEQFYGRHHTFEEIIEEEAQRFYAENTTFVMEAYSDLLVKYSGKKLPDSQSIWTVARASKTLLSLNEKPRFTNDDFEHLENLANFMAAYPSDSNAVNLVVGSESLIERQRENLRHENHSRVEELIEKRRRWGMLENNELAELDTLGELLASDH